MRFFSTPLPEVLKLPSRKFFWMWAQIERIEADEDLRMLRVLTAVNASQEAYETIQEGLTGLRGNTETFRALQPTLVETTAEDENQPDPEFDREGLRRLKARFGA